MPKQRQIIDNGPMLQAWLDVIDKFLPNFRKLEWADRYHMAELLSRSDTPRHRHSGDDAAFSIPYQELDRRFGRGRFMELNNYVGMFDVSDNWYSKLSNGRHGETRRFRPTEQAQKAIAQFLSITKKPTISAIFRASGQRIRKAPPSIRSRNHSGGNVKNLLKGMPYELVPVNTEYLHLYARAVDSEINLCEAGMYQSDLFNPDLRPDLAKMKYQRDYAMRVIQWSYNDISQGLALPHRYIESQSGRLYAENSTNLQTAPRNIRKCALHGMWDYDMENCHFTIFNQLAARAGYQADAIQHYIEHKGSVRSELAFACGKHIEQIKPCLLALMYGARRSASYPEDRKPPAIPGMLGEEAAQIFIDHPLVVALHEDIHQGGKAILKCHPPSKMGKVINAMELGISAKGDSNKIMAHLLQGIEAKMLEIARLHYPGQIVLLQHDGFTCPNQVDTAPLTQAIRDQLGFDIEFSEELLQIPESYLPDSDQSKEPSANHENQLSLIESISYDDISDLCAS